MYEPTGLENISYQLHARLDGPSHLGLELDAKWQNAGDLSPAVERWASASGSHAVRGIVMRTVRN